VRPGDRPPAVAVAGDAFAGAVERQLAADGFRVAADPDVVVLGWPHVTREALAEIRHAPDSVPRVAVVGAVPTPHLVRALTTTLEGVVLLDALAEALRPTLLAVLAGQVCHPLAFREQLERPLLSTREKQVLAMVVLGLQNAEIARKLYVTEAAVKAHLTSAFSKLGVRSRDAAAALILDPDSGYGPGILRITPDEPDGQR
jgi:DNA-binding NarL/FixJ family response regulator